MAMDKDEAIRSAINALDDAEIAADTGDTDDALWLVRQALSALRAVADAPECCGHSRCCTGASHDCTDAPEPKPGAVIHALARLLDATYMDAPPSEDVGDRWRECVANARDEYDRLRAELEQARRENAEFRAELNKKSCCKGCPDCVGIGIGEELRHWKDEAQRLKDAAMQALGSLEWVDQHWTSNKAARGTGLPMCRTALRRVREVLASGKENDDV